MLMQMLDAGGMPIETDEIREANADNPHGYYELERVKELNSDLDPSWVQRCRGKAVKIISYLLRYLPADLSYRVVFVRRHIDEVLASQDKMLLNRGEVPEQPNTEAVRRAMVNHLMSVDKLLESESRFEIMYINHRDMIDHPRESAQEVNRFLGGRLDSERMAAAVDSRLYRNRRQE